MPATHDHGGDVKVEGIDIALVSISTHRTQRIQMFYLWH